MKRSIMKKIFFATCLLCLLLGAANAQKERHASLPSGGEVDRHIKEGPVEAAKVRAEAADRRSADAQVKEVRAWIEAERANQAGHDINAARAEKRAVEASRAADKAKAEAQETQKAYDEERRRRP